VRHGQKSFIGGKVRVEGSIWTAQETNPRKRTKVCYLGRACIGKKKGTMKRKGREQGKGKGGNCSRFQKEDCRFAKKNREHPEREKGTPPWKVRVFSISGGNERLSYSGRTFSCQRRGSKSIREKKNAPSNEGRLAAQVRADGGRGKHPGGCHLEESYRAAGKALVGDVTVQLLGGYPRLVQFSLKASEGDTGFGVDAKIGSPGNTKKRENP